MAEMVRGKVASGDYASESEVIREGLRALGARDAAIEHWLATEVAESYDLMKKSPELGIPISEVRRRLTKRLASSKAS
jgi:antitoxin ParD1/3/4